MTYAVSELDNGRAWPNASEYVASVLDRVANLLSTRQLSCPMYRSFGLPMRFLDRPMNVAIPIAVVEITEGLREWVPEATLSNVAFAHDSDSPGKIVPRVEVEINEVR